MGTDFNEKPTLKRNYLQSCTRNVLAYALLVTVLVCSCRNGTLRHRDSEIANGYKIQYKRWIVSDPILKAGPPGSFDEIAVKDPTIVFYNNKYHLFYTGKASYETRDELPYLSKNGSGLGYVCAGSIAELDEAVHYDMGRITGSVILAPQVFYFEPQRLWYIIAQTTVEGKPDLMPVYLTNPDIENIQGWSSPTILKTGKSNNGFWIDFWVICDPEKAHLFYTDHRGSLFRFECPINEFPLGFKDEQEETVLTVRGENSTGRWRLHEASHIYHVRKYDCYLDLMEAVYPHPTRKNYWDSRNRFLFAMVADKLEGPWYRVESGENEFLGDPSNLYTPEGNPTVYDQVSHPELIRSGFNQFLEIEDFNLQLIFQAFDAEAIGTGYDYNYLPWKLLLMKNF
jgi:endo-1,4-beta-xylanase